MCSWVAADAATAEVLHPGFVVIRGALPLAAQLELAALAFERGDGATGWWVPGAEGGRTLNVAKKRAGKVYDAVETFPAGQRLAALGAELLAAARAADPHLAGVPAAPPTHLLLWNYRPSKGGRIGWHRDNWQGDGDGEHAVVSVSIGAACNFGWRPEPLPGMAAGAATENRSVLLCSGDVAVFGGVSRFMEHAVKSVHSPVSAPKALQDPHQLGGGRLNFTFRHAPADAALNVHSRG